MTSFVLLLTLMASNESVWVTDAMKAARNLNESTKRSPKNLLTYAEKTEWRETGNYDEIVDVYLKLAAASPYARMIDIGATPQGRRMYIFVASKDKAFDAVTARKTGKPIVFFQNAIHPGENGGKDAAVMLLRDILVTKKYESFLDSAMILSMPAFNVDGLENRSPYNRINEQGPNEMGFRVTAQRYNLNRDYMKADAPEMQNWLKAFNKWQPDMLIDNHVTDGMDQQAETTIVIHDGIDVHPAVGAWVGKKWLPSMWKGMEAEGHVMGWYVGGPVRPGLPFTMVPMSGRYSDGYAALRNRASLLVETHSLKPFAVRAWGHYDIMLESLKAVAASGAELRAATTLANKELLKPGTKLAVDYAPAKTGEPYLAKLLETETYQGSAIGGPVLRYLPKARDFEVTLIRSAVPRTEIVVPKGYYIPRQWSNVVDLLKLHGARVEPVSGAITAEMEVIRFDKVSFPGQPFEGRFMPNFEATTTKEKRTVDAGYFFVSTNQPLGRVVVNLLEPAAPDSMLKWGSFNTIFEQKEYASDYIFEPIAEKMLAENPNLKEELEAAQIKEARARMLWLYKRSPYYEKDKDVYPILRALE
ncbi:MAG: peptidase M14 [Acidobacteria bacterium]|nr:peptidase M14 [Acidobacteriota bacterium]